jgi:hypothetical protein
MLVLFLWPRIQALEFVQDMLTLDATLFASIQIVFVKSCDNDADLFTKNVSKDIYNKHVGKFLGKVDEELEKQI